MAVVVVVVVVAVVVEVTVVVPVVGGTLYPPESFLFLSSYEGISSGSPAKSSNNNSIQSLFFIKSPK